MSEFLTKRTVEGARQAAEAAGALVHLSKWFELLPLPNDAYEFTIKNEPGVEAVFAGRWRTDTNPHPTYSPNDWRHEVDDEATELGYHDWVLHRIESDG